MNEPRCDTVLARLPDLTAGRLPDGEADEVRAHVEACDECRGAWEVLSLLAQDRPVAPEGLAERIEWSLKAPVRRGTQSRPWWGLAAAAVAALALGIGVVSDTRTDPNVPAFVAEAEDTQLWLSDDGSIAGAPSLDGLSDEALLTLLEEMGTTPTGGAA